MLNSEKLLPILKMSFRPHNNQYNSGICDGFIRDIVIPDPLVPLDQIMTKIFGLNSENFPNICDCVKNYLDSSPDDRNLIYNSIFNLALNKKRTSNLYQKLLQEIVPRESNYSTLLDDKYFSQYDKSEQFADLNPQMDFEEFKQALENPRVCDYDNYNRLLNEAAENGQIENFKFLLLLGATITEYTGKSAIAGENFEIINICYNHGCKFYDCFEQVLSTGNNEIADFLLKIGRTTICPIDGPVDVGNFRAVMFLLKNHASPMLQLKYSIIKYFIYLKNLTMLSLFSDYLNLDLVPHIELQEMLHFSCMVDNIDLARKSIELCKDPNYIPPNSPYAPLHYAVKNRNLEMVELLVESFSTVIHINIQSGYIDKFNVNITPLQLACQNGNIEIIEYLLKNGANIQHNAWGKTIFDDAKEPAIKYIADRMSKRVCWI